MKGNLLAISIRKSMPKYLRILRGEPDRLEEKLRALDRLAKTGLSVTLVSAIERGVNEHEIGKIVDFAIQPQPCDAFEDIRRQRDRPPTRNRRRASPCSFAS